MTPFERIASARSELSKAEAEIVALLSNDKSRRRAPFVRQLHELRAMLEPGYAYRSQAGQDAVIDLAFQGKTGGTFVDIGGYDGITGSNTLFFEQRRGWSGVLVEPVAVQLAKAKAARKCPCFGFAVAPTAGEAEFIEVRGGYTQMSGLSDSYDTTMLARIRKDPRHSEVTVKVQTKPIQAILSEAGIPDPDFISLDIEGGELAVLRAFPFEDHRVETWAIENNSGSSEILDLMKSKGYDLIEFCGPDEIYRRRT